MLTRMSSPCPKWRRRRLLLPSHVQAPARPVAQHRNSGEKEKTSVLALLRHINLLYRVASDEKLLEMSHGLGTGGPAGRAIARLSDRTWGGSMERYNVSPFAPSKAAARYPISESLYPISYR